jgi:molecular chaperone GrpE
VAGSDKDGKGFKVVDRRHWVDGGDGNDEPARDDEGPIEISTGDDDLRRELADKEQQLQDLTVAHQLALTELDSARERLTRELGKEAERNRRSLLVEFLDVIDNLDRAIEAAGSAPDPGALREGVAMVRDMFVGKLRTFGVTRVEALGHRFDPARHEAITVVPVEDPLQDGRIVGVIREGYSIGDEVLRPAGVAVARAPD